MGIKEFCGGVESRHAWIVHCWTDRLDRPLSGKIGITLDAGIPSYVNAFKAKPAGLAPGPQNRNKAVAASSGVEFKAPSQWEFAE